MKNKLSAILLLIATVASGQTKGIVKDSLTGNPLPYVSIWVENEHIGMTSEADGTFEVPSAVKGRRLIFSSLGFENKKIDLSQAAVVLLNPTVFALDEVVIQNRKETRSKEIGITKSTILEAFENGPRIDVKFFPYLESYNKTRYIKKLSIKTDSQIESASFKIHFYSVNADGFPGAELINRDYIVAVTKGSKLTIFDVGKFNLVMPKNGIFVGFEKLRIENNKVEKIIFDKGTNSSKISTSYAPLMLYNRVARDFTFTFSEGKWSRQVQSDPKAGSEKMIVNEPSINLTLTN